MAVMGSVNKFKKAYRPRRISYSEESETDLCFTQKELLRFAFSARQVHTRLLIDDFALLYTVLYFPTV